MKKVKQVSILSAEEKAELVRFCKIQDSRDIEDVALELLLWPEV